MRTAVGIVLALGCASTAASGPTVGDEFTLRIGERVTLRPVGIDVRFAGVASDSRCPIDVQCVWAGDAAAVIETTAPDAVTRVDTLHTTLEPRLVSVGTTELRLVSLAPRPNTANPIRPDQYTLTLATRRDP